mmetsp:Transcript_77086/g.213025  ORF Transcript_77086/g.213025 Transcript_77086/m.213025 type:complete len:257 (+) Transcript_77086:1926-2696(+)
MTRSRLGRIFRSVSAITWPHFSSKTRSTFCTFTLAPCSSNRSLTRTETSSKRWSMERCSNAKCTALRHRLSTAAYFLRMGPASEKRLSLFTCSSANFESCARTKTSNSWCISCSTMSRKQSSCPRKALSMACTSPAAPALSSSRECRSMSASHSSASLPSTCFCTSASQNSCSCCAMSTCRMVRNCSRSVPHIESVCQTVRAWSYHCEREAKEDEPGAAAPTGGAPLASRSRCFCEALARAIQWKTFSRSWSALSA